MYDNMLWNTITYSDILYKVYYDLLWQTAKCYDIPYIVYYNMLWHSITYYSKLQNTRHDMGGGQNYGPILGPLNTRCRIILRNPKGTIVLTTIHILEHAGILWYTSYLLPSACPDPSLTAEAVRTQRALGARVLAESGAPQSQTDAARIRGPKGHVTT